ncbi:MAG: hypothetical protein AAGD09_03540 [Cyanobacteria bacterium P01_F01_bin.56]
MGIGFVGVWTLIGVESLDENLREPLKRCARRHGMNLRTFTEFVIIQKLRSLQNAAQKTEGEPSITNADKASITFWIDVELKEPLQECAKIRQMSMSTFVANLVFRELREAHALGEAPKFVNIPW